MRAHTVRVQTHKTNILEYYVKKQPSLIVAPLKGLKRDTVSFKQKTGLFK